MKRKKAATVTMNFADLLREISVNDIVYVPKSKVSSSAATPPKGLKYCIIRTFSAGCFAGYLKSRNGKEGIVLNARRLWHWEGAATLSQLAVDGTVKPRECKFPMEVPEIELTEIIEVIPATEKARLSIAGVEVWKE
jgi:hypothetical protein